MNSTSEHSTRARPKHTLWGRATHKLNFYRTHLLFFTFTPLVFSAIFYASNGRNRVSYTDSLFTCVSVMTICGLSTINLSAITPFQQALLFILMCTGNPIVVSWVIVYIRRYYFSQKFQDLLASTLQRQISKDIEQAAEAHRPWPHRFLAFISGRGLKVVEEPEPGAPRKTRAAPTVLQKLRPDMIRRMDDAPKLVNPSGLLSEGGSPTATLAIKLRPAEGPSPPGLLKDADPLTGSSSDPQKIIMQKSDSLQSDDTQKNRRRLSDPGMSSRPPSPAPSPTQMHRFGTVSEIHSKAQMKNFPRTQTIEFAPDPTRRRERPSHHGILEDDDQDTVHPHRDHYHHHGLVAPHMHRGRPLHSTQSVATSTRTQRTHHSHHSIHPTSAMTRNFGGFPSPFSLAKHLIGRMFPGLRRQLTRAVTIPATVSLTPGRDGEARGKKYAPYISFDAVVGRNSKFHLLTQDQLEEIGGVEYRALNALLWILALYHIGIQLLGFIIITPYMSTNKWSPALDSTLRPLNPVWFSLFQVVSAYTNTGMSLVDESMVPFQKAYLMVFVMMLLILAGNTSFPIFLRFMIWVLSKMVPEKARLHETLHFLLDHPRRCFIYLFPSHQTWSLFAVVVLLTFIDWFFVLVLDIGKKPIEQIPVGVRVLDSLFQGVAVRAAGFTIVPISSLVPAVQVLYVVMMYISAYPLALSVRSTNVYEEQSLGVFDYEEHDGADDESKLSDPGRTSKWSQYLSVHARQQLAFDIWWLALSLFIICIIERNNIENEQNFGWFTIFSIIFELVSAYGTVGLSLGIPNQNYSFVGALHPLSKLVFCVVMLRGRHRALPVAIDRAIMLPHEFKKEDDSDLNQDSSPTYRRPYTYSETMNSRHTGELRQRVPGKSARLSSQLNNDQVRDDIQMT